VPGAGEGREGGGGEMEGGEGRERGREGGSWPSKHLSIDLRVLRFRLGIPFSVEHS
jgi:hypothetical protein